MSAIEGICSWTLSRCKWYHRGMAITPEPSDATHTDCEAAWADSGTLAAWSPWSTLQPRAVHSGTWAVTRGRLGVRLLAMRSPQTELLPWDSRLVTILRLPCEKLLASLRLEALTRLAAHPLRIVRIPASGHAGLIYLPAVWTGHQASEGEHAVCASTTHCSAQRSRGPRSGQASVSTMLQPTSRAMNSP